MASGCSNIDKIYSLSKLLICKEIKLSAWSQNEDKEILALFIGNGEFIFYFFTKDEPILKQVPWFSNTEHNPVSICFDPSGTFLLVLSQFGHIYIVPVLTLFDSTVKNDQLFDTTDITVYLYPFPDKAPKQSKPKAKSPNSSLSIKSNTSFNSGSSSNNSSDSCKRIHSSSSSSIGEGKINENLMKLKELKSGKTDIEPTVVTWWQSIHSTKPVAAIGTKLGEIIFVDLTNGQKVGNTSVQGNIKNLEICQNNDYDNAFLLITLDNKVQYKVVLEQRDMNFCFPIKECSAPFEDDNFDSDNSGNYKGNYLPAARARLQGLKQLSVEKIATLKQKLAETRSKPLVKDESPEDISQKINNLEPDYVWGRNSDVIISPQTFREKFVVSGHHSPTQFLSVHTAALESVPICTYKLPVDVEDVLLSDTAIFTVSKNRCVLQVISSHVSQVKNSSWDFNPDSILGKWDLRKLSCNKLDFKEIDPLLKPDPILGDAAKESSEQVIALYKRFPKKEPVDFLEEYDIEKEMEDPADVTKVENCLVVTNKCVYVMERKWSVMKIALNWILRTDELEKVERLCGVYKLNLSKLFELAGDIRLASSDVCQAYAFYKVSECGVLKIAVKLSATGHCSHLLKYAVPLIAELPFSDMSQTERIHLSNLIVMAYTQQILSRECEPNAEKKFIDFLQKNPYYDGVLAVSVTGQSFLFKCLHKLISHKGLILDGYTVLVKLIQRFLDNKSLEWTINKDEFWKCLTENCLIEAMVYRNSALPVYADYVIQNADSLDRTILDRLLILTDPTSPYVRSVAYTTRPFDETYIDNDEAENHFQFQKLVELFTVTLLVKINKFNNEEGYNRDLLLQIFDQSNKMDQSATSEDENIEGDSMSEQIWPIRKGVKENEVLKRKRESVLSCGFGHSALIRNGAIYTWGQTAKGCLGQGPTMSRYSSPIPITWLGFFKLEVTIVSCGKQHTVALTNNGLYAWGCSAYGQLGLGDVNESPHPRLVSSIANENIITVKCGQYHTLALTSQGSVFAWGWGVHGQLGLGTVDDERIPKYVHTLKEQVIVDIAAGHGHTLVLSDKGHVYSFGSSVYGQLGTGNMFKSSKPVLVKGITGKVVKIATGYFHNLAITDTNTLYTWGISPISLRRKRQRLLENEKNNSNSPGTDSDAPDGDTEEISVDEGPDLHYTTEKADDHLSPTVVDTKDVKGKIVDISCGCNHSVLITESGSLYTWGRSFNQNDNAPHREMLRPTLFNYNNMKVDAAACGCEFTIIQDKQTGKIYGWGSNNVGQLGIPVEESSGKGHDGKMIMLRSNKRTIRIPQTSAMTFMSPREVPDIPPSSFTYQTLNKHSSTDSFSLSQTEGYFNRFLHYIIEKYKHIYNVNFILKKCIEHNNYQASSKVSLLEGKFKQSMIYQLKCLQNTPKYHPKSLMSFEKQELPKESVKSPKSELMTPDSEIHLFTEQGGKEELCDGTNSQDISNSEEDPLSQKDSEQSSEEISQEMRGPEENYLNQLKTEYVEHAKFILDTYLTLSLNHFGKESNLYSILETGIQFWTAEKLPLTALEDFLLQKLDVVYYDLGYLLFCQSKRDVQYPILQQFSSNFLLRIASKLLTHIEKNGSCFEYLETMSKIIGNDKPPEAKKKRESGKPDYFVEAITEKLKKKTINENYITVPSSEIAADITYYFSCGHCHSHGSLRDEFKLFDRINNPSVSDKLIKLYESIDENKSGDLSCPSCVYNYIKQ